MTIYKKNSLEWPVQQKATEQKFRSGLFTVSAEFIRPTGENALPTSIDTSIGPVGVGDIDPTITTGTDGFERIQVVGYSIWNVGALEERISLTPMTIQFFATTVDSCGTAPVVEKFNKSINIFAESIFQHFPKSQLPFPPQCNIFKINSIGRLENITGATYNAANLFGISRTNYAGDFKPQLALISTFPQSITRNFFGDTITTEVVYSISPPAINFGFFQKICSPPA
jgi:hypothetical protein